MYSLKSFLPLMLFNLLEPPPVSLAAPLYTREIVPASNRAVIRLWAKKTDDVVVSDKPDWDGFFQHRSDHKDAVA